MLTDDQTTAEFRLPAQAWKALVATIKSLHRDDVHELMEIFQMLHATDDQEELDSLVRAAEEILEQKDYKVSPLPLTEGTLSPGLKGWSEHVGRKIKEIRKKSKMRQTDLAKAASLSQTDVSRIESGQQIAPHLVLERIARALAVDVGTIDPCLD